jgi:hypothetical protein
MEDSRPEDDIKKSIGEFLHKIDESDRGKNIDPRRKSLLISGFRYARARHVSKKYS